MPHKLIQLKNQKQQAIQDRKRTRLYRKYYDVKIASLEEGIFFEEQRFYERIAKAVSTDHSETIAALESRVEQLELIIETLLPKG